jgi:hypothetical protein
MNQNFVIFLKLRTLQVVKNLKMEPSYLMEFFILKDIITLTTTPYKSQTRLNYKQNLISEVVFAN